MRTGIVASLLLLSLFTIYPGYAAEWSGDVSGTWTLADSPVVVVGDIAVPSGSSLTISPGVAVLFAGPFKFTVNGTLTAAGTVSLPIVFTRAAETEESRWQGIRFESADDASTLEYCIIQHVYKYDSYYQNVRGGGVLIDSCSPTIRYCLIRNNFARNDNLNGAGGGIFINEGSTSLIEFNQITDNESDSGGGIYVGGESWPVIRHNVIENNLAYSSGGGIYVAAWAEATIDSNIIRTNTAYYWGGGGITLWNNTCSGGDCMDVFNNIIYQNNALRPGGWGFGNGGGIYCRYNKSNQFNNTIVGNISEGEGGGIYVLNQGNTYPDITNTIVWGNSGAEGDQISLEVIEGSSSTYYSAANITYSNVEDGWTGTGNIAITPLFSNPPMGDFQLLSGSGGIDAGTNNVANLPPLDFGVRDRIIDGDEDGTATVDIGAFEYEPGAPLVGDIDRSGSIDLTDTILLLKFISGEDIGISEDITGIDCNSDGKVGMAEAIFTLQYQALNP